MRQLGVVKALQCHGKGWRKHSCTVYSNLIQIKFLPNSSFMESHNALYKNLIHFHVI